MTISLIIAIIVIAAVLFWIFRSGKKESHHLDKLHINPSEKKD